MEIEKLPRWLAVGSGRLIPVPWPSTGPDVFCKLQDAETAIASAVAAERERCAKLIEPKNDPNDWTEEATHAAFLAKWIRSDA